MATTLRDPAIVKAKIGQALQAGDQRKALALGERLFKLLRSSPADCMSVAELAESLSDVDLAVLALRQACRRSPEDVQVLFRLAETEHLAGHTVEALDHLEKARGLATQAAELDHLANLLNRMGDAAAALPNAKVIHTRCNPMDTCYAILKQPFLESYYYSYDQKELGGYFLGYKALMDHGAAALPGRIIDVHYEDMVADSETVAKDLVARLGLEWEDACLDHTANRKASTTARRFKCGSRSISHRSTNGGGLKRSSLLYAKRFGRAALRLNDPLRCHQGHAVD